jgi:hypothetical protein
MSSLARSGRALACVVALFVGALLIRLATESVTIGGNAGAAIWPGAAVPVDVTVDNGYDFPVSVTNLRVQVLTVHAPHADNNHPCTVADFVVDQASPGLEIPVGARATSSLSTLHVPAQTWPRIHLLQHSANRDGCQGATLTFGYAASKTLKFS